MDVRSLLMLEKALGKTKKNRVIFLIVSGSYGRGQFTVSATSPRRVAKAEGGGLDWKGSLPNH